MCRARVLVLILSSLAFPALSAPPSPADTEARGSALLPPPIPPTARGADFWIGETGPTGPIFTGPHQYPFICQTVDNGLGQPFVDNQEGIGNAVFPEVNGVPVFSAHPVGYSRNCSIATRVDYFYYSRTANNFRPLANPASVPADTDTVIVNGMTVNFVVRLERGTINRFIYGIAMLAPFPESLDSPGNLDNSAWNGKLAYVFQGGVGIGHAQGGFSLSRNQALHYDSLKRGYAVAYSTGNRTGTHYNLRLAEETALMVKRHFLHTYGKPDYTVGIGGSGGAIQQYVIGQNNRHVIDAAIPQLSYPDMITQTIYVGDCELLERYFDREFMLNPASRWADWRQRALIEGLATNTTANRPPWNASPFAPRPGSSECINGWRGSIQLVLNPAWAPSQYFDALALYRYPPDVVAGVKWTHWNDLGNIYPQDEDGFAPNSWDNVGVQYGLRALVNRKITVDEFLDLNSCVGGWKQPREMVLGNYPWNPRADPRTLDPWDQANMNVSAACKSGPPAPRTAGSVTAINAAYTSGHVFTGDLRIPIVDIRWYLEPILDMHHTVGSFSARARMLERQGHAENQVIWVAACSNLNLVSLEGNCAYDPTGDALDVIAEWMANIQSSRGAPITRKKPARAVDSCFTGDGGLIHAGADAWDGILDAKPAGACTAAFPLFSTSRITAGGNLRDDVFKCALKPVHRALADSTYGGTVFTAAQAARLKEIFPSGVCDYSKPDVGKPSR